MNAYPERLRIELLFLDLTTCTRCRAADRSLERALELVREELDSTATQVEVARIHIESAEQARELRFESSPTIRINGRDIALELRETSCGSEPCTADCSEHIACRVWVHGGQDYTEPPVSMIVDAILREVYAPPTVEQATNTQPYSLPENLNRFFAGKAAAARLGAACCSAEEQRSCCAPVDKAECCGSSTAGGCGCR